MHVEQRIEVKNFPHHKDKKLSISNKKLYLCKSYIKTSMLTKEQHIKYWTDTAKDDWKRKK